MFAIQFVIFSKMKMSNEIRYAGLMTEKERTREIERKKTTEAMCCCYRHIVANARHQHLTATSQNEHGARTNIITT